METAHPSRFRSVERSWLSLGLAGAALVVLAAACAPTTSTTQTWSAELTAPRTLRHVLVTGFGADLVERRQLEDKLVEDLAKRGVAATPSYELFPEGAPLPEQAREAAAKAGFDGVLATRLRAVERRGRYLPPTGPATSPGPPFVMEYAGGGTTELPRSAGPPLPGAVVVRDVAKFETNLWDARGGALLWSATTQTEEPSSGANVATSIAKTVTSGMEKAGFAPKPR